MAYENKPPEDGTIFLSPTNSQNPKAPQFKGKGRDDKGREIELAFWEGTSRAGKPWKMVRISPPYQGGGGPREPHPDTPRRPQPTAQQPLPSSPTPETAPPDDSDVPFHHAPRAFDWRKIA